MKPTKCQAKEKNEGRKVKKEGRSERAESKSQDFLCMPKLHELIFCIWIRGLWSVQPVNDLW